MEFQYSGEVLYGLLQVLPTTRLTFYGPRKVPVLMVRNVEADEFYQNILPGLIYQSTCIFCSAVSSLVPKLLWYLLPFDIEREVGVTLTPPTGKQREIGPGLQVIRHFQIKFEDGKSL